jgi:molybdopterin/thiamine biosynthesis adenylyltransferase/rhodanese-related sulfurtransferase
VLSFTQVLSFVIDQEGLLIHHTMKPLAILSLLFFSIRWRFSAAFSIGITHQNHEHRRRRVPTGTSLQVLGDAELTNSEISRYSRHLVLSDVGMKGQAALKNASVLVIGAGGLGSPCLLYLAAAGVGHIGVVDADTVDESNLQRQIIHGTSTVGKTKCQSAKERILDINPNVHVRVYEEEFTSQTALRILQEGFFEKDAEAGAGPTGRPYEYKKYDVVVDGSDNFPTKYLINDACDIVGTPWVYSAILAFEGQLSTFNFRGGPTYRDLLPTPPPPGDVPSCAEGGVLGVLPGTMGCLQATEVLKILLGRAADDEICSGRVLIFDAMKMKFGEIGLAKQADRDVITDLIDYQGFCAGPKAAAAPPSPAMTDTPKNGRTMDEAEESVADPGGASFHSIEPKGCLNKLSQGWAPWVLDVRLQTENDIVALPFTDHVAPHRTVRMEHIPISGDVLVYCKAGVRGKKACNRLIELGVNPDRLYNLDGGIMKWQKDVDPAMPTY